MELQIRWLVAYNKTIWFGLSLGTQTPHELVFTREELKELADRLIAHELELQEREHQEGKDR